MDNAFRLDRRNAKWMGVCAGLANKSGIDATLLRVLTVVVALCTSVVPVLLLYILVGLIARG